MTQETIPDLRRKRILYRATHRGTKEADAVVGGYFASVRVPDDKLDEADALLEEADLDIMDWVMGRKPVPDRWKGTLYDEIAAFYAALGDRR